MKKKGSRAVAAEVEEVAVACSRRVKLLFRNRMLIFPFSYERIMKDQTEKVARQQSQIGTHEEERREKEYESRG